MSDVVLVPHFRVPRYQDASASFTERALINSVGVSLVSKENLSECLSGGADAMGLNFSEAVLKLTQCKCPVSVLT